MFKFTSFQKAIDVSNLAYGNRNSAQQQQDLLNIALTDFKTGGVATYWAASRLTPCNRSIYDRHNQQNNNQNLQANKPKNGILLVPNPTKYLTNVALINATIAKVQVYGLTGAKFYDEVFNEPVENVDISTENLPNGTYMVVALSSIGKMHTELLIVQH